MYTITSWYVWGIGPAASAMIREGEPTEAAVAAAQAHGFDGDNGDWTDAWAVLVRASEEDVDAATRFDRAVVGFCKAD